MFLTIGIFAFDSIMIRMRLLSPSATPFSFFFADAAVSPCFFCDPAFSAFAALMLSSRDFICGKQLFSLPWRIS